MCCKRFHSVLICFLAVLILIVSCNLSDAQSDIPAPTPEIQGLLDRGKHAYKQYRYQEAQELWQQALDRASATQDKSGEAYALVGLGVAYQVMGNISLSTESSERALALFKQLGDLRGQGRGLSNLAICLLKTGHLKEALVDEEKALLLFTQVGDEERKANTLSDIGLIYFKSDDLQNALTYYRQALPLHQKNKNEQSEAITLDSIGMVTLALHQPHDAEGFFQRALPIYLHLGDKKGEAQVLNRLGICHSENGQYQEALVFYEQARSLYEQLPDTQGMAEECNNIALAYFNTRQYEQAVDYFGRSRVLYQQLGNQQKEAEALSGIANARDGMGQLKPALDYAQQALSIFQRVGDVRQTANTLNFIGTIYFDIDHPARSLEYIRQAQAIFQEIKDVHGEADCLSNIGSYFTLIGKPDQAIAYLLRALALHEQVQNRKSQANTLANIGVLFTQMAQPQQAMNYLHKALALYKQNHDTNGQATALGNLGMLHLGFGQPQIGLQLLRQGLMLFEVSEDRRSQAAALMGIAGALGSMGDTQAAQNGYQRALELDRELGDLKGEAITRLNLGNLYAAYGNAPLALEQLEQADSLLRNTLYRREQAYTLFNLALAHSLLDHSRQALDYDRQALDAFQQTGNLHGAAITLGAIGRDYVALGQPQNASVAFQQAVSLFESVRTNLGAQDEMKSDYLADNLGVYYRYLNLLVQQHRDKEAFELAEKTRARALVDILQNGKLDITHGLTAGEKEHAASLRSVLETLQTQWIKASYRNDTEMISRLKPQLEQAAQELQFYQADLYSRHPQLAQRRGARIITLGEVPNVLPQDTALLEYVICKTGTGKQAINRVALFALTSSRKHLDLAIYTLPVNAERLAELADAFRSDCANPKTLAYRAQGVQLFSLLLPTGVQRHLADTKIKRLIVCPDGPLWDLPFAALLSPRGFLWEQYELAYAYSATGLKAALDAKSLPHPQPRRSLLAVGDPDFGAGDRFAPIRSDDTTASPEIPPTRVPNDRNVPALDEASTDVAGKIYLPGRTGLSPLPNTQVEVQTIANLFPNSTVILKAEAQESRVKREAGAYRYLHFATHGFFNDAVPLLSNIALAQPPKQDKEDGFLTAREIADLSLCADMVVLSGCETGRGAKRRGEGLLGLTWALFVAGCPTQVVSHWNVDDASTSQFMAHFYKNIVQKKMGKAAALREAGIWLMRSFKDAKYAHPAFWSPFFLVGDWQ